MADTTILSDFADSLKTVVHANQALERSQVVLIRRISDLEREKTVLENDVKWFAEQLIQAKNDVTEFRRRLSTYEIPQE